VVIALAVVLVSGWHDAFRNALADLRFNWLQREASGEIVIVSIDSPSLEKIGVWPWPRRLHAELLRQLEKAGARDVAFDVDFSAPSDAASDQEFAEALQSAGGSVVLPWFKQPGTDASNPSLVHVNRPLKPFADASWAAAVNVTVEADGRVRHYPFGEKLGGQFVPSMAAVLAEQYNTRQPRFLIDFGIRTASIPKISFVDVLLGNPAALARVKDKRVVIGGTALELGDRFSIPNGRVISGPVMQALAAESILQGRTLHWTSDVVTLVGIAVISLVMMLAWRRLAGGRRVIVLFVLAAVVELAATLLQARWPFVLDTSLLHVTTVVYLAAIALDEIDFRGLLGRIAENRFHRIAMSLGEGLICTDRDYRITVWNPGAEAIFGYQAADMIGQPFDVLCAGGARGTPFSIRSAAKPTWLLPGGAVVEFEGRRKSGEVFPAEACFSSWQGTDGLQYGAILRDISLRKREAARIRYLAEYDSLTGLANRATLQASLSAMISSVDKSASEVALLVIGLDGFQQINQMLGHACGDQVLQAVSDRLTTQTGRDGVVARLSGDEFAIAVSRSGSATPAVEFAEALAHYFDFPLAAGTREHRVKISIGLAIYPEGGRTADELLSNGHLALSRAKATRRGGHVRFESSIRDELEARLNLEAEIALAVERQEFELFYQPQVHLVDGSLIGAEALIRWRHPERGLLSPGLFMPVVNSSPISERIAGWVMQNACEQARKWELAGCGVRVGINLSPSQLRSGDLAQSVSDVLEKTGLTPSLLELEVTEDIILQDEKRVLELFERIQKLGVRLVFDDFGTGYASLSYLKKFPLDGLKIDRSFVMDLLSDLDDTAIVSSTIGLSRQLGLSVIAEGIESRAIADALLRMGCEEGQGYFFGRPMPASDFEARFVVVREVAAAV
jgi:diguanylate cyclase (GGDEF)-like protein/PAS domain S-box-containing protein